jgi:hypothetical protein
MDIKKFSEMYLNKAITVSEIAKEFNISNRRVWVLARSLNLKIRSEKKYKIPELNQRFNKLVFIKEIIGTGNRKYWECKCDCGKIKEFPYWSVFIGTTKSCGCYQRQITSNAKWKGHGEISGKYWTEIKEGAKRRQISFELTIEEGWELFLKQNKKCNLSGLEIEFSRMKHKFPQTASLDRIDNSKGYITGNIQWLHKSVNLMKHCFDEKYFTDLCVKITENLRKKNE